MGNFDKEKNILKKFARKGQCFSTSKLVCKLEPDQVTLGVEDILRNGHCFTDGVGYISPQLAEKVAKDFRFSQVSAFQIRLAGAKGVLMVKQGLQGDHVQLRNSQTKFPSDDLTLNVIRCSTFGQGYLNRSIILLLNSIGVDDEFFLKKQRQAKDFADVDRARQALEEYNELKAQPGLETQARKNQLKAHIRELHQGVLGGRKFHY